MSDQTSIFNQDNQNNSATQPNQNGNPGNGNPPVNHNPLENLLAGIKNEQGEQKYSSVEEALKALAHSQAYIPQLKNELDTTKSQLSEVQKQASKIEQLEQTIYQLTQNVTSNANQQNSLSEEDIAKIVSNQLTKTQQEAIQRDNIQKVVTSVKNQFGDKSEEIFYNKAKELGMSVAEFNALAARTPKAVLDLLGVNTVQNVNRSIPNSTLNTAGLPQRQDSAIVVNTKSVLMGATTQDIRNEMANVKNMVEELHASGKSTYDLTDPKFYFNWVNKKA